MEFAANGKIFQTEKKQKYSSNHLYAVVLLADERCSHFNSSNVVCWMLAASSVTRRKKGREKKRTKTCKQL